MELKKEEESNEIKIIVKEGKEIALTKKASELSELLKGAINEYPKETSFPLNESDENNGELIKEYLSHFNGEAPKEIEKPITSNEIKNLTDEWSSNFIDKIPLDDLTNLTVAANYMGINCLLDLCCAKVATLCKDKNEEDIFKMFKITETFNKKKKNKIKSENKWIEENL